METAINVTAGVAMLSASFVVIGLLGRLLLRGVPMEELRTNKVWRSDRAAWAVRFLRPATSLLVAAAIAFVALAVVDSF